ncbi:non-functional pseudokinase ZED1-like [Pistacia vera]|uniref:non-functional pseudokinase ZED1-like n=1 Tax=Pistacia vera TaxID=55513 RepID=UPI001263DB3A|nr:non-functional pseudokinase ZED1-like [Pistacia vera]
MMSSFLKGSKRQKQERFLLNGKILLKELIASSNGKYNPIRSFTDKEIKIATNNYDQQKIITKEVIYSLYKGFLQDRPVSVMKFSPDFYDQAAFGINSIVFASQMSHKNILKLIGCCLESEVHILVFESVEYGTLANHIYRSREPYFEPLLLTHRLKIAMELANAIAYLHFKFPRPIVFRMISPFTIVFNEKYVAKLCDFSNSISMPEGETHIEESKDRIIGIGGFFAPERFTTPRFNEKVDVYSFGVLLLVLLTGLKTHEPPSWITETRLDWNLEHAVKKYIDQERFTEIVDPIVVGSGLSPEKEEQLQAFAELAFKCLSDSAVDRPTMIDVAKQLRHIYNSTCQLMS